MLMQRPRRLVFVLAYLLAVAGFTVAVWWVAYGEAMGQTERRGRSDLALAADSLKNELERYRNLSVIVADHPEVRAVLEERGPAPGDTLRALADKTGSLDLIVVDANGTELAQAAATAPANHAGRPYFERALDGALGVYHLQSQRYARRSFLYAAPVFGADGPVIGAAIVVVDVEAVEAEWRGDRPTVFFTDELGVIFVSNRSELILAATAEDVPAASRSAEYPPEVLRAMPDYSARNERGRDVWTMAGSRYLPQNALHLTLPLPVIAMTGEALIDLGPARWLATLQAAVAAALCLTFGAMLFLATERRRTLAEANQRLEARVAQRTSALEALNADLQREVAERREAQAQLTRAQADLVQAGKLSALGQMSAGISHELNQPLMAIRSFAENAQGFLDQGKTDVAAQNLGRISDLARRMGRIIRNLRAFARQESEGLRDVDLHGVVERVLEMVAARMTNDGVTAAIDAPAGPVMVRGGEVRLQQVVLNLVTNALDAMAGTPDPALTITISQDGPRVTLAVRDTGPGLADPEKVFEPFYSTKQIPDQDGMGLGLSISYGLVQSFGGQIRGRNHPDGGAVFFVELDAVAQRSAA